MNEDTRVIISQIGNKEYNELSTENRLMIELSILELFYDGRSKTSITFHKGEEKPIGINNKGVVYGCTDKIDVYNEHEEKKLLAEFNKLFEAKEETFGGIRSDFIENELKELEFYNSPTIRNEHIILNMWKKYLTNKKNVNSIAQENIKPEEPKQKKLSHRQIVFIYQYENKPITESNAQAVLIEYERPNDNGKALANKYRKFNTPNQRTAKDVKTANDIRTILPFLSETAKQKALKELETATINQSKKKELD